MGKPIQLKIVDGLFSIYKFNTIDTIPPEVYKSDFLSITRTDEELSIVCRENSGIKTDQVSHNWRCLRILGPLDFSMVGIINHITTILKEAQISVFVISTYNTDYFLIQEHQYDRAILELRKDSIIDCKRL